MCVIQHKQILSLIVSTLTARTRELEGSSCATVSHTVKRTGQLPPSDMALFTPFKAACGVLAATQPYHL